MEIKKSNHIYQSVLKQSERFAGWITERIGTIGFFFLIFIWTISWLIIYLHQKLLLDQNISYRLVKKIESLFPGTQQVKELGLHNKSDRLIEI